MNTNNEISGIELRILILEDSRLDFELIMELLSDAGYILDVTHVDNKTNFTSSLRNNDYDIILSDFSLPGFNAFGALQIRNEICPEVPFICVSGSIGEETAIDLLKLGAVDYVLKDRPDRLPFSVKRALDEAKESTIYKRTAKALQESEYRFKQVAEGAQEWIWEVNPDGLYTYASPVCESLLGYTSEEIVNQKYFYDFFVPNVREELKRAAFEAFSRKEPFFHFENANVHKNGELLILTTSGSPIIDEYGNLLGYRGVDTDITKLKKHEEQIRKLSIAVEQSPSSIVITDLDAKIEYVNEALIELVGYSRDELIGYTPAVFKSEQTPLETYEDLWKTILSGNTWKGVLINRKKNGELYYEKTSISPMKDENGLITNYFSVKLDVTKEKEAEFKILQLNEELERKVNERTLELTDTNLKLNDLNATKDKFFSIIAHDLKNPFNSILAYTQLLLMSYDIMDDERILKIIRNISDSAGSAYSLLENLLEWARSQTGRLMFNPQKIAITELFKTVLESTKNIASQKKITINTDVAAEIPVYVDKDMINTVLRNLISNAIKFTPTGGKISLKVLYDEDFASISIVDNGLGISPDIRGKLFKINEKVCKVGTNNEQGTGLGLILCKEFVEKNGGKIWVESEEGKGSVFTFTVPYTANITSESAAFL